jgi:Holliday junction resolvasome RuvABC endonuclease subunit
VTVSVGLDLSLRQTGVAVITGDGAAEYFSFGRALSQKAGNYDKIKRYIDLTQRILKVLKDYPDAFISMENYGFGGPGLAVQCEFGGIVKSQIWLAYKKVPVTLPSTVIRKLLLGSAGGKSIKEKVAERLRQLGYPRAGNYDETDALAVAHVVRQLFMEAKTPYDQQILEQLTQQMSRGG